MRELITSLEFACLSEDIYSYEQQKIIKKLLKDLIKKSLTKNTICDLLDELYVTSIKEFGGDEIENESTQN